MNRLKMPMCALALVAALVVASPTITSAQDGGGKITVSWDKAFIEDTNLLNSAFWFGYMRPMGSFTLQVDLPFAMYDPDITGADGSSAIGNPRIGILKMNEGSSIAYMAGVRLPLAGDDADASNALFMGALTNPLYKGPWMANNVAVDVGAAYFTQNASGFNPYIQAGIEFLYDTDAPDGADTTEFFIPFVLGGSMAMGDNSLMFGVAGSFWVTEDDGFDSDNPFMAAMAGYQFTMGNFQPSIWAGIPISSDYGDMVDFLLSIGVGFGIP